MGGPTGVNGTKARWCWRVAAVRQVLSIYSTVSGVVDLGTCPRLVTLVYGNSRRRCVTVTVMQHRRCIMHHLLSRVL
jgi:hypothetical protein